MEKRNSQLEHVQPMEKTNKHEAGFAHANQVWLAVNYNTSITSGE